LALVCIRRTCGSAWRAKTSVEGPLRCANAISQHSAAPAQAPRAIAARAADRSNVRVVQWSDWFAEFSDKRAPERFTLRFDRAHMSFDAAAQGLGVALESTTTGGKYLAEGQLRPVLGMDKSIRVEAHFAVYPVRHAKRPPVEAFLSWLHGEAAVSLFARVQLEASMTPAGTVGWGREFQYAAFQCSH
jgi:DNA-binding transcriptional LysR family regulator